MPFAKKPILVEVLASEAQLLRDHSEAIFVEAFGHLNTVKDMQMYLSESMTTQSMTTQLHNPESIFYWVKSDQKILGYLKLNWGDAQNEPILNALEIERIYVYAVHHRKGLGQIMMEKANEMASSLNKNKIWLGVWEENHKAIAFYEKNGFTTFGKHEFLLGTDLQYDVLMSKTRSDLS